MQYQHKLSVTSCSFVVNCLVLICFRITSVVAAIFIVFCLLVTIVSIDDDDDDGDDAANTNIEQ